MMKKPVLVCNGHTSKCIKFFYDHIEEFAPVTKLTSFFEPANFLLTPYQVDNNSIHTILENDRGEEMHLAGVNCGYAGSGPGGTQRILVHLGVAKEDAENWRCDTSLSVDFTGNKPRLLPQFSSFFEDPNSANSSKLHISCLLTDHTYVNTYDRVVYMVNPSPQNLHGYFNCLNVMKPTRVIYSLGKEPLSINLVLSVDDLNSILQRSRIRDFGSTFQTHNSTGYINLVIYGKSFNLVCCAKADEIASLVYSTYYYLLKKPIKDEAVCEVLGQGIQEKKSLFEKFKSLILPRYPQSLVGGFDVPDKKSGRGVLHEWN